MLRFCRRLLAALLGAVLAILVAEVGLRLRHDGEVMTAVLAEARLHQRDPVVGYRLVPGSSRGAIHIDSHGLRGPDRPLSRAAGVRRILCLGDSITWGEGIEADADAWPARLEAELDRREPLGVEVWNGGVMGYGSRQCLHRIGELLPLLEPDLVLVCAGWNDLTFARQLGWHPGLDWVTPNRVWQGDRSYLWDLLRRRLTTLPPPSDPRALAAYRDNLERIVATVRASGAAIALLDLPTVFAPDPEPDAAAKAARNGYQLADAGAFLELRATLRGVADRWQVPLLATGLDYEIAVKTHWLQDVCHPDAAGMRRLAATLAPQVADLLASLAVRPGALATPAAGVQGTDR